MKIKDVPLKKIMTELAVLLVVIAVAAGLMLAFTVSVSAKPVYTQMTGRVITLPVNVSSPVYGQIVALHVMPGQEVRRGEAVAVVQMLDPQHANVPKTSPLYKARGHNRIEIDSPTTGTVAQVYFADLSTIGVGSNILQIFTTSDVQVQVEVPRGTNVNTYAGYYATDYVGGPKYPIKLLFRVPNLSPDPSLRNYDVYAASFKRPQDAQTLLTANTVTVLAQKPPQKSHYLPIPQSPLPKIQLPSINLP